MSISINIFYKQFYLYNQFYFYNLISTDNFISASNFISTNNLNSTEFLNSTISTAILFKWFSVLYHLFVLIFFAPSGKLIYTACYINWTINSNETTCKDKLPFICFVKFTYYLLSLYFKKLYFLTQLETSLLHIAEAATRCVI